MTDEYKKLCNNDNCLIALEIQNKQNKIDYKVYDLTEEISNKNIEVLASTNYGNAFVLYFKFPTDLPEWFEDRDDFEVHIKFETILKLFGYPEDQFSLFAAIFLRPHSHSYSLIQYNDAVFNVTSQKEDYWNKRIEIDSKNKLKTKNQDETIVNATPKNLDIEANQTYEFTKKEDGSLVFTPVKKENFWKALSKKHSDKEVKSIVIKKLMK